jgi:hypothetical protein
MRTTKRTRATTTRILIGLPPCRQQYRSSYQSRNNHEDYRPWGRLYRADASNGISSPRNRSGAHARVPLNSLECPISERLVGGERRIRTPETLSHSMEGILSSLGHYAASKKSSRAEENLLSTWIRLFFAISVVSLVRYARARRWMMSNVRQTFRVRIPTDFQARSQTKRPSCPAEPSHSAS